jgi:hypothetical protein
MVDKKLGLSDGPACASEATRHWFSLMGTFLPFEIITYAI